MADSDGILVSRVLRGQRQAFAELYDRRARLVRALCRDWTADDDAAADLTQEVFLRAYQKLDTLREPERFAAWLAGIARQVCREWYRHGARRRTLLQRWSRRPQLERSAAADRHEELQAAMSALSDKERFVLHAYYVHDRHIDEVCRLTGLSRSGAYHVLAGARHKLQRRLSKGEDHA